MEKVALVTGASRGIGAACAVALGEAGYRVALHYRSQKPAAEDLARRIPGAFLVQADLSEDGTCQEIVKAVTTELGSIDILVNNAGIAIDQILPFAKPEDFDKLISTNLRPVFLMSKYASKPMIRRKWGRIINMTSVVGHSGNGGQSLYAATKAAATGFTKSIAYDLAKFGITANSVAPGFIETDMTNALPAEARTALMGRIPLGRFGTPQDVAAAVVFLASEGASYVTGSTIHVNGGMLMS